MKTIFFTLSTALAILSLSGCSRPEPSAEVPAATPVSLEEAGFGERLGTVHFPVSCNSEAQQHMNRGLALLHHMTYEGAEASFSAALETDATCAMAYWGQAMTIIHPLWPDAPDAAGIERGNALLEEATSGSVTTWERAFIEATQAYFREGASRTEADRLASFSEGWQKAYKAFPENLEAAAFYALAHMATAPKGDMTFRVQMEAGAIAETVLARNPDHPGAHHYIIHAYDYPSLANRAREVSNSYGNVAPNVPHALHMPTHIFTRLGLWDESIDWNKRSASAARHHVVNGAISMHYLHALDYLAYAHLQRAEDSKATAVLDSMNALSGPLQPHAGSAYTSAAVPARLALERKRWKDAAMLTPRVPESLPWDKFAQYEAITRFARALGAAFTGDAQGAQVEIDRLGVLRDNLASMQDAYWTKQVDIQYTTARAWLAYQTGETTDGLELMREAAEMEATTQKNPITPGEVLPAHEMYGDMLLAANQPAEALEAYRAALDRSPNRYNGLFGAGRAAEMSGDTETARMYYEQFLALTAQADSPRSEIEHARAYMR